MRHHRQKVRTSSPERLAKIRNLRRSKARDKLPPHKIVMKEIHGQLVPVKVFKPQWAEGASVYSSNPKPKMRE